ncbi:ribbon-helix-helix domain-containing protein [Knoellia subterranea]|uniref:Ribbon-helix-helix protein CopG domain-containing protein n=1 Tax=Knoellia subterranea KCTC 19937 TaxID=1385521 RepID=A0A0A0JGE1_9MICO|nr:ribbon-helix-helix domain-containing protein [Knoellia subterranea]KGN36203.1 hypothetical protein N803_04905 [Knoellia subterranea KCTC 19937]
MSTQISVRLSDGLVAQLDALVSSGGARSRAAIIESALERELRARIYAREAEVLAAAPRDPELDEWVSAAASTVTWDD